MSLAGFMRLRLALQVCRSYSGKVFGIIIKPPTPGASLGSHSCDEITRMSHAGSIVVILSVLAYLHGHILWIASDAPGEASLT